LWHHLHFDPRRLPYAWVEQDSLLCCRLRRISAEQRQRLESEVVADYPEIELRILALPNKQPELVEVVFPPAMAIDQAKQFIFREVEELALNATASGLRWLEEPDSVVLALSDRQLPHDTCLYLENGIRESVGKVSGRAGVQATSWQTCCLEFERAAGWHRQRAQAWLQARLGFRDLGRTVGLTCVYRMDSELRLFVSSVCAGEGQLIGDSPSTEGLVPARSTTRSVPVEFVPVPQVRTDLTRMRSDGKKPLDSAPPPAISLRLIRGGAGLELNMADRRYWERLPADLRSGLSKEGFANYLEAQEIVRTLTALASASRVGVRAANAGRPRIAVLALYPAQVDLIRRMAARVPALAALGSELIVDVPSAFRQQEADIVLLSLTRSHTHRAVAFGDDPDTLVLGMTRARQRLIIFGDPGTLARRSQWDGAVEHLDQTRAAREQELVGRLVRYIQGQGDHPGVFRPRLGSAL
jgi:hypothetical protein